MDAHLSATLENTAWPEGDDIPRDLAGYLVRCGGVIVRAVEVYHLNIRTPHPRRAPVQDMGIDHRGCDGTRRSPRVGSIEWWSRGLASRMAMSHVLEGNLRDGHQAPQLLNRIHRTASIGRGAGLVAGCHRRWQPSALMADVRSLFRSGTRAAYPPAGGCGPAI